MYCADHSHTSCSRMPRKNKISLPYAHIPGCSMRVSQSWSPPLVLRLNFSCKTLFSQPFTHTHHIHTMLILTEMCTIYSAHALQITQSNSSSRTAPKATYFRDDTHRITCKIYTYTGIGSFLKHIYIYIYIQICMCDVCMHATFSPQP
jgi:hypothetical protein